MTILVVDDIRTTAESVAELLATMTGLSVRAESDPNEAIRFAESNFLTVVVLDEEMPKMKGTELWARIRSVNSSPVALMLTQERGADAARRAMKLGYRDHLYKNQIDELPDRVLELHIEALAEFQSANTPEKTLIWKRRSLFRCRPELWLLRRETIDEHWVSSTWHDYATVASGQTVTARREVSLAETLTFEEENSSSISSDFSAIIAKPVLAPKLQASITARRAQSSAVTRQTVDMLETTYSLAAELPDFTGRQVRSRTFEYSRVFARERLVLSVLCPGCGTASHAAVIVRVPLNLVATRQIDYFDDNTRVEIETGDRRPQRTGER